MISIILVPTDGSRLAQKAAVYAVDLAKNLNASVIVLSIVDSRSLALVSIAETGLPEAKIESALRETAKGNAQEIIKLCDEGGIRSKAVITTGYPVEEIVKEAGSSKADLIVMGSHGRSALTATVLGSVAYGVIHKDIKIPVMVVKG